MVEEGRKDDQNDIYFLLLIARAFGIDDNDNNIIVMITKNIQLELALIMLLIIGLLITNNIIYQIYTLLVFIKRLHD